MLSRFERRRRRIVGTLDLIGESILVFLGILTIPATFAAITYWIVTDTTVANHPFECFDTTPNCEVVEVVHKLTSSSAPCDDQYTYRFKLPVSPIVYFQRERIRRADEDCGLSDLFQCS